MMQRPGRTFCPVVALCWLLVIAWLVTESQAAEPVKWREWTKGPLTGSDLAGQPPSELPVQNGVTLRALVTVQVNFSYQYRYEQDVKTKRYRTTLTEVRFAAVLDPARSWQSGMAGPGTLRHEQGHFDLAELHARRATRLVAVSIRAGQLAGEAETQEQSLAAALAQLERLHRQHDAVHVEEQLLYDRMTLHGSHPQQQATWDEMVARRLREPATSEGGMPDANPPAKPANRSR